MRRGGSSCGRSAPRLRGLEPGSSESRREPGPALQARNLRTPRLRTGVPSRRPQLAQASWFPAPGREFPPGRVTLHIRVPEKPGEIVWREANDLGSYIKGQSVNSLDHTVLCLHTPDSPARPPARQPRPRRGGRAGAASPGCRWGSISLRKPRWVLTASDTAVLERVLVFGGTLEKHTCFQPSTRPFSSVPVKRGASTAPRAVWKGRFVHIDWRGSHSIRPCVQPVSPKRQPQLLLHAAGFPSFLRVRGKGE